MQELGGGHPLDPPLGIRQVDGAQAQAGIGEELSDGDHVGHPSTPPGSSACANGCSGPRGGAAGVSAALAAAPEVHVAHQRAPT